MNRTIIDAILGGALGCVLASCGITFLTLEFWAVFALITAIIFNARRA